ncbi:DUF6985 domain-containing protein [Gilliamella sp. WF3-4]|jgi:hypothetical protein|uniref:DUF6985 domain-containing protein n=1 Tax=Gilliamella sp. WF3-4 TaxID=3120255 RepID=UPI00080EDD71|nr:hypothetical protein [Gilliamella apicola]OCG17779.1 hypothetical protein A9G47_08465 [Gilliamella apicola]
MKKKNSQNTISYVVEDEGIAVDIILPRFGQQPIPVIYLESFEYNKQMKDAIDFITSHQIELYNIINNEMTTYISQVYNQDGNKALSQISLTKIYILLDEKDEYGLMFAWSGDSEHGIGIKMKNMSIVKIGVAEIAFL